MFWRVPLTTDQFAAKPRGDAIHPSMVPLLKSDDNNCAEYEREIAMTCGDAAAPGLAILTVPEYVPGTSDAGFTEIDRLAGVVPLAADKTIQDADAVAVHESGAVPWL